MIEVVPLDLRSPDRVLAELPVSRVSEGQDRYLVAWDGDRPVGHLHLAWHDPPELQDVFVLESERGRGIARALIEAAVDLSAKGGADRIRLEVSSRETELESMYGRMGFRDAGLPLRHVAGEVQLRTGTIVVNDDLRMLERLLNL
jgi:GNAT superfamily N-acetyltransferase